MNFWVLPWEPISQGAYAPGVGSEFGPLLRACGRREPGRGLERRAQPPSASWLRPHAVWQLELCPGLRHIFLHCQPFFASPAEFRSQPSMPPPAQEALFVSLPVPGSWETWRTRLHVFGKGLGLCCQMSKGGGREKRESGRRGARLLVELAREQGLVDCPVQARLH